MATPQWTWEDLNPPPPVCKTGALPDELQALAPTTKGGSPRTPRAVGRRSCVWRDSNPRPPAS